MTMSPGYEIDFLPVGQDQDGDAIVLRWGYNEVNYTNNPLINQKVVIIDTGFSSDGEKIRTHINNYYFVNKVDLIIITHPDLDHIGGLKYILENMEVGELWIHRPLLHGAMVQVDDRRVTENSKTKRLIECKVKIEDAIKIAQSKNIIIKEPFQGLGFNDGNGFITVLAPTKEYYESLLPEFIGEKSSSNLMAEGLRNAVESIGEKIKKLVTSNKDEDDLNDDDTTSAVNKSSAIILFGCCGDYSFFTGDAGIETLDIAYQYLTSQFNYNLFLSMLKVFQIPHHGSKRNLGPTILNKLFSNVDNSHISAVVSCIKTSNTNVTLKHPHQAVINAFKRRNINVYPTKGLTIYHSKNMPSRKGWSTADSLDYKLEYFEE
ncbi:ComEC/Rec2 family competence protein [Commensalibacter nepenthis]|uniref:MBL fold metallo-hydrolase n=1 Tax=Commensalibacter nepenthis TaxID=3043872 RepID=A0ABT6Q8J0_9PROT|nr:MBL fold metallo-hydrolase [Commensalibacter sp. TBRC 10068]MDI2113101.1 MBL fold metallo-hydrolase [Commensalibacter sp. TBRC 10068]